MKSLSPVLRRAALITVFFTVGELAVMQFGCAKPQTMISAEGVPASQGTVKATEGENGNTKPAIHLKHPAAPAMVAADATAYVASIQSRHATRQTIGALVPNDDREGTPYTVTAHRRFQSTVPLEPDGQAPASTNESVFTFAVDR